MFFFHLHSFSFCFCFFQLSFLLINFPLSWMFFLLLPLHIFPHFCCHLEMNRLTAMQTDFIEFNWIFFFFLFSYWIFSSSNILLIILVDLNIIHIRILSYFSSISNDSKLFRRNFRTILNPSIALRLLLFTIFLLLEGINPAYCCHHHLYINDTVSSYLYKVCIMLEKIFAHFKNFTREKGVGKSHYNKTYLSITFFHSHILFPFLFTYLIFIQLSTDSLFLLSRTFFLPSFFALAKARQRRKRKRK